VRGPSLRTFLCCDCPPPCLLWAPALCLSIIGVTLAVSDLTCLHPGPPFHYRLVHVAYIWMITARALTCNLSLLAVCIQYVTFVTRAIAPVRPLPRVSRSSLPISTFLNLLSFFFLFMSESVVVNKFPDFQPQRPYCILVDPNVEYIPHPVKRVGVSPLVVLLSPASLPAL